MGTNPAKILLKYLFLFSLSFFLSISVQAQKKKKKSTTEQIEEDMNFITQEVNDTTYDRSGIDKNFYFNFKYINVRYDYYNREKLAEIDKLIKANDKMKVLPLLEDYVLNFGIHNFSEDTHLLWKLAQLYESLEMHDKAKAAFRLVLKHHKRDQLEEIKQFFKIQDHFNEMTEMETDIYVPLEYYYKLVEYRKDIDTLHPPRSVLTNMGEGINEKGVPDYAPYINMSDNYMIYTKKNYDKKHTGHKIQYNEDLYFIQKNEYGLWSEFSLFPSPINSDCTEGSACITNDGKTLFFTRCPIQDATFDCMDGFGSCDIFVSEFQRDSTWSNPENLGKGVNSYAWDSQPTLSITEDTLFFVSNRKEGFGLSDIYYTFKDAKGDWTKAQNMGPIINTRNNEYSPFYSKTDNVFYFSSNGQLFNFGDISNKKLYRTLDIYKSRFQNAHWIEPKNIGPLVNGEGDEYYFSIDSKSENLYYAKTEDGEEKSEITDLFSFPVPMGAQPNATTRLHGTLTDKETGKPYDGIVSIIDLDNGIEVAPKRVRSDGSYDFDLIDHNNYLLVIQGDEFFRIETLFEINGDTTIDVEAKSIKNKKLRFTSIVFENGKADILPEMDSDLWNVINFMVDNPTFDLTIGGHTDSDGNEETNQHLSQDRANAIKQYLINKGNLDESRITAIGYGSVSPIRFPEVTEEDKQINRRVEFEIKHNEERYKESLDFNLDDW
jgi:outer membrane protein OmpA-like peptidoglycan-associated protein